MRRKILIGIITASLSAFFVGCGSTSPKEANVAAPIEKTTEEEKREGEDEYIDKISTTIVNISLDGSLRNMRAISETGEISPEMREEIKKSNTFFQCLVDDFSNSDIPEEFIDYNEEILTYLKSTKEALGNLENSESKEDIQKYADKFINDNKEISNVIDKVLLYFAGC